MLGLTLEVYQRISICTFDPLHHAIHCLGKWLLSIAMRLIHSDMPHTARKVWTEYQHRKEDNAAESSSPRVGTLIACRTHEFQ
jgi:hypothetical protein